MALVEVDTVPFEVVTTDLEFPEGPVALPDGDVLVVEVRGGRLTRVHPDGTKDVVADVGGGPNGAAIGPDGAAYVVNNGGFAWTKLPDPWIPVGENASNEPRRCRAGRLYWSRRLSTSTRSQSRRTARSSLRPSAASSRCDPTDRRR